MSMQALRNLTRSPSLLLQPRFRPSLLLGSRIGYSWPVSRPFASMDKPKAHGRDRRRRVRRQPKNDQPNTHQDAMQIDASPAEAEDSPPVMTPKPVDHAPEGPLAAARFADLSSSQVHPTLVKTIVEDLKFEHMSPVQAATIHELLPPSRADCLVRAKTGTGKTLAFLLPALQTLLSNSRGQGADGGGPAISLLVISPTRELALQIAQEATNLLQRMPQYRVCTAIGGTNKNTEERRILAGCSILIATPGRLLDHMSSEKILYTLRRLDTLVLDEADRLLDMGFMKSLREIVDKLPNKQQVPRQGMLFSATIGDHVNNAAKLILTPGYKYISTVPEGEASTHERVPQLLVKVDTFSNVAPAMVGCMREEAKQTPDFKAIVFAPTAALADFYGHVLSQLPDMPPVSVLHSRISQGKRTQTTNDYRNSKNAILVATDVIARGMDFPGVTTVFQVGIPSEKESYIHRLGRTARAGAEGRGIFIVCAAEEWFPRWQLKEITFLPHNATLSSVGEVQKIAAMMEEKDRAKIYQAWLGYYKNHLKGLKWDNTQLVAQGNTFARESLQCPETPGIAKSTVGKMGLRGTKGLVVVPDPPKPSRGHGGGGGGGGRGRGGRA